MTLLGAIPTSNIDASVLIDKIHRVLDITTLTGQPYGIILATAGVTIPVYFGHKAIHTVREKLRQEIGMGQDYTTDSILWEHIGWFQIMRFLSEPSADLATHMQQFSQLAFPPISNPRFALITTNSKTLAPDQWNIVAHFETARQA